MMSGVQEDTVTHYEHKGNTLVDTLLVLIFLHM